MESIQLNINKMDEWRIEFHKALGNPVRLQIVDYLTVNQTIVLINKSLRKQEETIHNSLKEMEERHRREMNALHQKYENELDSVRSEMENRFKLIVDKIDISKINRQ